MSAGREPVAGGRTEAEYAVRHSGAGAAGGLTPTPKALALEPKVAAVIASFEDLFVEETFDPASLVREFRIACADHAMFYIGPAVTLASRTAPGVTFWLSPTETTGSWSSREAIWTS